MVPSSPPPRPQSLTGRRTRTTSNRPKVSPARVACALEDEGCGEPRDIAASIVDPSGSNLRRPARPRNGQIDPIVISMAIPSQEDGVLKEYGASDLLNQTRVVGAIVAEGGLERPSFAAATRMGEIEHVVRELVRVDDCSAGVPENWHGEVAHSSSETTGPRLSTRDGHTRGTACTIHALMRSGRRAVGAMPGPSRAVDVRPARGQGPGSGKRQPSAVARREANLA
jgi:hypothetical protein